MDGSTYGAMRFASIAPYELHRWKINLDSGEAQAPDVGCTKTFAVKLEDDEVWLSV